MLVQDLAQLAANGLKVAREIAHQEARFIQQFAKTVELELAP